MERVYIGCVDDNAGCVAQVAERSGPGIASTWEEADVAMKGGRREMRPKLHAARPGHNQLRKKVYLSEKLDSGKLLIEIARANPKIGLVSKWEEADIVLKVTPAPGSHADLYSYVEGHRALTEKAGCFKTLQRLGIKGIMPATVVVSSAAEVERAVAQLSAHPLLIVKPSDSWGGNAVRVVRPDEAARAVRWKAYSTWVVQEYIADVATIQNTDHPYMSKYDIRVNIALMRDGRIAQLNDVHMRVSDEEYRPDDISNQLAHITNTDLRERMTANAIRILGPGPTREAVERFMADHIRPLVWEVLGPAADGHHFQRLGVDLLVRQTGEVCLLEINANPGNLDNNPELLHFIFALAGLEPWDEANFTIYNRMSRGAGTAVLGGVEHVVSGWAAYEIERRDARWEATGKPPGVYGGRAYVYAEDVVESLPRPNALQKAALRLSSSLRRFEDRACEPNEDGLWECVPLSQPAAGYFATPPVTSADLQEFAASPAQQKDPALLELMSRDLSQLAAEEHEPLSDMPVLPQRMASPADRRSIRGLEVSVLPYAAALELRQARLATQMSRAADLVDGQLDTRVVALSAAVPGAIPGPPALKVFVGNKVRDAAKLVALAKKNARLEVTNRAAEADLVIAAKPDASVQPGAWRSAFPEARRLTDKLKLPFTVREWCADSQVAVDKSRVAVDDMVPETQVVTTRSAVKQVVELFAHSAEHLPRLIVKTDLKNEKCSIQVVANGHLEEALGSLPAVVQEFVEGAQSIKVHVGLALDGRFVWFREALPEKVETFLRERAAPLFKWALDVPGCFQRFELDLVVDKSASTFIVDKSASTFIVDVHANPGNPRPELLRFIYMLAGVEEVSPAFGVA